MRYIFILFHVLKYVGTISKYDITNNTVRVVDKSAKGGLNTPFLITPPSKAIFDLLPGRVWLIPVRLGYLRWEGAYLTYCLRLSIRSIYHINLQQVLAEM